MRNTKRILAGIIAAASVFGIVGCGKSQKSEEESYVDKVKVEDTDQIAAISDGAEKDLIWLSYFDINPTKREPETRTDLDLSRRRAALLHIGRPLRWRNMNSLQQSLCQTTRRICSGMSRK